MHKKRNSPLLYDTTTTQSSLLIPTIHLAYFLKRCMDLGNRAEYLHYLISQTLKYLPKFAKKLHRGRDPKWKTHYQKSGQKLLKRNLQPDSNDWEILRHAASAQGVSMCFLFVFLMEMEQELAQAKNPKKSRKNPVAGNSMPKGAPEGARRSFLVRKLNIDGRNLQRRHMME